MQIAVYLPDGLPESFCTYSDNVIRELRALGCDVFPFQDPRHTPEQADVVWDPRSGGGSEPIVELCRLAIPLVITVHGVAPMAMPLREYFHTWHASLRGWRANRRKCAAWRRAAGGYAAIITVSEFSKRTIARALPIPAHLINPCHNALDHRVFRPAAMAKPGSYLLHISNDEPRKNVDRICRAYLELPSASRPPLVLKLPGNSRRTFGADIQVLRERLAHNDLAALYQGALAFVFPSLYEGFGLPILEAMACGCPVITANDNACAEVAADAALTVDPRSVTAIRAAMQTLCDDSATRARLSQAGLRHATKFSWETSARCHLRVFLAATQTASSVR
jgi:glycosyltransferase involved in cell wall biosynthesis